MTATVSAPANVARARQLLHSSAEASKQLEENVRELVTMRAWDVLGYESFSEMWEKENDFECPRVVRVLAVEALIQLNPIMGRRGRPLPGHLRARDVAAMIGFPTLVHPRSGAVQSSAASAIIRQLLDGVPAKEVRLDGRARPKARRTGAGPDDFVQETFLLVRRDADAVDDVARSADMNKADIYRQAVAEYLARYRDSRPKAES